MHAFLQQQQVSKKALSASPPPPLPSSGSTVGVSGSNLGFSLDLERQRQEDDGDGDGDDEVEEEDEEVVVQPRLLSESGDDEGEVDLASSKVWQCKLEVDRAFGPARGSGMEEKPRGSLAWALPGKIRN